MTKLFLFFFILSSAISSPSARANEEMHLLQKAFWSQDQNSIQEQVISALRSQRPLSFKKLVLDLYFKNQKPASKDAWQDFVIRFKDPSCRRKKQTENSGEIFCNAPHSFNFSITYSTKKETLTFVSEKLGKLTYQTSPRLEIVRSRSVFGDALHLFENSETKSRFFIIRERQVSTISKQSKGEQKETLVYQELSLFKLEPNKICRVAAAQVSDDDFLYEELVDLLHAFHHRLDCSSAIANF